MNGSTAEYCRQAAAPGSTLYYSLLFHAADERRALCALFAYQAEIDRVIDETTEAAVGHARLQWWQEETGRIFQSAARHPIGMELHWLTRRMVLDPAAFASCIAAAAKELGGWCPETYADWIDAAESATGGIWSQAARACGAADPRCLAAAQRAGALHHALGRILHAFKRHDRPGHGLPLVVQRTLQAETIPLAAGIGQEPGRESAPKQMLRPIARRTLVELLEQLGADYRRVFDEISGGASRAPLFSRVTARIGSALCTELLREPEQVLRGHVAITPVRKLWIAWREHRRTGMA